MPAVCLMLSQVLGIQWAESNEVSSFTCLWRSVGVPTSRKAGLAPLGVLLHALGLASYYTFRWVGHLGRPSERSFSNCALGAQGSQGEITWVRGGGSRRDSEPCSLPSASLLLFSSFVSWCEDCSFRGRNWTAWLLDLF